jgi:HAD superfamily hydrolase (TIGR01549 family)
MGGDRLVGKVAGDRFERDHGDEIRSAEADLYAEMTDEVVPFDDAQELLRELRRHDYRIVLASSAKPEEVERYVEMLDARDLADGWTTADDVESTKPSAELVEAALEIGSEPAVMVGDTVWDVIAARKAGVPCLAVLTGGISALELRAAGAVSVYRSVSDLAGELQRGARLEDAALENGHRSSLTRAFARRAAAGMHSSSGRLVGPR